MVTTQRNLRIPLLNLKLAISVQASYAVLRTCRDPFGISRLLGGERSRRSATLPLCSEVLASAFVLDGFGPVAGAVCLPPISKINAPPMALATAERVNYITSTAPKSSAAAMLPIHAVRPTLRPEHMKRHYQTCRQRHPASHRASLFSSQTLTLYHAYHFRDFSCRHKAFRVWRRGEVRRTAAKVSRGRRRRNRRRNRRRRLPQGNPPRRQLSCPARRAIQQTACRHGVALGGWGE